MVAQEKVGGNYHKHIFIGFFHYVFLANGIIISQCRITYFFFHSLKVTNKITIRTLQREKKMKKLQLEGTP